MCGQSLSNNKIDFKLDFKDQFDSSLAKALAISTFTLDENFKSYPEPIKHSCLWAINDYIEAAIKAADNLQ